MGRGCSFARSLSDCIRLLLISYSIVVRAVFLRSSRGVHSSCPNMSCTLDVVLYLLITKRAARLWVFLSNVLYSLALTAANNKNLKINAILNSVVNS